MGSPRAAYTTIVVGEVRADVGLYKTTKDSKAKKREWATAGPNGGVLRYEKRGAPERPKMEPASEPPTPEAMTVDPLSADPGPEPAPPPEDETPPETTAGEFRQVLIEEGTDEVVEPGDVRRGIRLDDDRFVDLTDHLAAIDEETKLEEMRVVAFVDSTALPRVRVKGSYWIAPRDPESRDALRFLFAGLKKTRRAGLAKWTKSKKQALGIVVPFVDGLAVIEIAWTVDVVSMPSHASLAGAVATDVDVMTELIEAMEESPSAIAEMVDDREERIGDLLDRARAGEVGEPEEPKEKPAEVVSLVEALRKSRDAARAA